MEELHFSVLEFVLMRQRIQQINLKKPSEEFHFFKAYERSLVGFFKVSNETMILSRYFHPLQLFGSLRVFSAE